MILSGKSHFRGRHFWGFFDFVVEIVVIGKILLNKVSGFGELGELE